MQRLWVNLIVNIMASLALAYEPPSDEVVTRKPSSKFDSLITPDMLKNIIFQALAQIAVLGTILFKGTSNNSQVLNLWISTLRLE